MSGGNPRIGHNLNGRVPFCLRSGYAMSRDRDTTVDEVRIELIPTPNR